MFVIRPEQRKAFRKNMLRAFEDRMVQHLNDFAPRHCEVIGEYCVREVIGLGIDRAESHGLTNRGPIRFYIDMMFLFGSDFDTDPQYPWAGAILSDPSIPHQTQRAGLLYEKTMDYLRNVAGPESQYLLNAMRRLRRAVAEFDGFPGGTSETAILRKLESIYPQKARYLGDEALRRFARLAVRTAEDHAITSDRGVGLLAALIASLGHGFAADRLFPWASKLLDDPSIADPNKRAERLSTQAGGYLDAAVEYLERSPRNDT